MNLREGFVLVTENAVLLIDAIALVVIVLATVQACGAGLRALGGPLSGHDRRAIWLRYARWLVAGLTFQLAADIVETSITAGWDAIARMAAVAAIRTALNWFLDRDLSDVRERDRA